MSFFDDADVLLNDADFAINGDPAVFMAQGCPPVACDAILKRGVEVYPGDREVSVSVLRDVVTLRNDQIESVGKGDEVTIEKPPGRFTTFIVDQEIENDLSQIDVIVREA